MKKKIIVFIAVIIIVLAILVIAVSSLIPGVTGTGWATKSGLGTCVYESDNGQNYFMKGYLNTSTNSILTDYCSDSNTVVEYFCGTNNEPQGIFKNCSQVSGSNGVCINGACQRACVPNCDCVSNTCLGQTCSNGCGGTCAGVKNCASCSDSDGGNKISMQGSVSGTTPDGYNYNYMDYCVSSNLVNEYYCLGNNWLNSTINCPNGCSAGRCFNNSF